MRTLPLIREPKPNETTLLCCPAFLVFKSHAQTDSLLLRFPAISPDGKQLAFSFQGDIWTVDAGGQADRRRDLERDKMSYSNAEIFSHAYKNLGIGKLVGHATNGSVISTGGRSLVDGSFVRLPFRGWFTKATDKNQELGPAIPDIQVDNSPDWLATGTDNQLKTAVDELLKQLDANK
jgi:hypothetical protein